MGVESPHKHQRIEIRGEVFILSADEFQFLREILSREGYVFIYNKVFKERDVIAYHPSRVSFPIARREENFEQLKIMEEVDIDLFYRQNRGVWDPPNLLKVVPVTNTNLNTQVWYAEPVWFDSWKTLPGGYQVPFSDAPEHFCHINGVVAVDVAKFWVIQHGKIAFPSGKVIEVRDGWIAIPKHLKLWI
ncbi:MAG: hypothetical protein QXN52_04715 [Nitrososphaerota archaeon]